MQHLVLVNRDQALHRLREHEAALRSFGVARAALFGSTARGDRLPESDIDVLVEFSPSSHVSVYDHVDLNNFLNNVFCMPVDVINRRALKPPISDNALRDAVYAF